MTRIFALPTLLRSGMSFLVMLLVLLLFTFLIGKAAPIDPVLQVVGDHASPQTYREARQRMGLDQPMPEQFLRFVWDGLHGDLGRSTTTGRAVVDDLRQYFPATLELASMGIVLGVLFGVPLGILAAHQHNRWIDQVLRAIGLLGYSVPVFWLGLVSLLILYARLGWVGGPGRLDDIYQYTVDSWSNLVLVDTLRAGNVEAFRNGVSHLVLPASLLGYFALAYISRMTRAFFLEELGKEYVFTARVKGATELRLLLHHVLPNVAAPLVTVIALSYAGLLEGAVLTETVFSWPGIGLYVTNALFSADLSAVLGGTLLVGLCFIVLNAVADMLSQFLDPRARS